MKFLLQWIVILGIIFALSPSVTAQPNDNPYQYFAQEMIGAAGGASLGIVLGGLIGYSGGHLFTGLCSEAEPNHSFLNRLAIECPSLIRLSGTMVGSFIGMTSGAVLGINKMAPEHIQGNIAGAILGALLGEAIGTAIPLFLIQFDIGLSPLITSIIFTTTALGTTIGFNLGAKVLPKESSSTPTQSNWAFELPLFNLNF